MQAERRVDWGISAAEYARKEKMRIREKMKQRARRARIRLTPPPPVQVVENYSTWKLKGQDIQELGIVAVVTNVVKKPNPIAPWSDPVSVPMSLPWVTLLYGSMR